MKPTDKQIKEFWEWCGFKQTRLQSGNMGWLYPPEYSLELGYLPDIDLNNLFKYAVPKLAKESLWCQLAAISIVPGYVACVESNSGVVKPSTYSDDPALALFWAIKEVQLSNLTKNI